MNKRQRSMLLDAISRWADIMDESGGRSVVAMLFATHPIETFGLDDARSPEG
jgi:hypothetical protein